MMHFFHKLVVRTMALISIVLSLGMVVHDHHYSQVMSVGGLYHAAVDATHATTQVSVGDPGSQHAHADYNALSNLLTNSFRYQSPSIAPERRHRHKPVLGTLETSWRHAFDNPTLPVLD